MQCSGCQSLSWSHQDPSIMVLIANRTQAKSLMARSPRHPRRFHTALAGFVEAGETFEKAVMREAFEETGVRVDPHSMEYISSQAWPFPRSCMIGFRATADDSLPLTIDPIEIVTASWFDKSHVAAAAKVPGAVMNTEIAEKALAQDPSLSLLIPPTGVLARTLIDNWLEDGI
jgi:NAD+ diphosphatase